MPERQLTLILDDDDNDDDNDCYYYLCVVSITPEIETGIPPPVGYLRYTRLFNIFACRHYKQVVLWFMCYLTPLRKCRVYLGSRVISE
jgi:hypothetical protein